MLKNYGNTFILIFVVILIAGCSSSAPAAPLPSTTDPAPLTAEQLIAECAQAMGGSEQIDALETIRLTQHLPDHDALIHYEILRPNRIRMGDALVFDGEQAAWLEGELVPQGEWADFEVDIAWYVPAFFDYPAEYLGTETVDDIETHKLQVVLPLGAIMTYYLDTETYLVYKAAAQITIGDQTYYPERTYSDYQTIDGMRYALAFTYPSRDGLEILTATINSIEFNAPLEEERFSIPAAIDQVISIENAPHLERITSLDLPASFINSILFTEDNRYMITGDRNQEVLIWERETWNRQVYQEPQSNSRADDEAGTPFYSSHKFSPDGSIIVTANSEGDVTGQDWDGNALFAFSFGNPVYSTAISPKGDYLAVGGLSHNILIFDLEAREVIADLPSDREYITVLTFSPDGKTLLAAYERPQNVMVTWDTTTWEETAAISHIAQRFDYHDILFTPDGEQIVIASTLLDLEFLDLATQQVVKSFRGHSRAAYELVFSPDGSLLASAADDGTVRLWNVETGDIARTIVEPNTEIFAIDFSPDGTLLAFGVGGEGIQVWGVGQ